MVVEVGTLVGTSIGIKKPVVDVVLVSIQKAKTIEVIDNIKVVGVSYKAIYGILCSFVGVNFVDLVSRTTLGQIKSREDIGNEGAEESTSNFLATMDEKIVD